MIELDDLSDVDEDIILPPQLEEEEFIDSTPGTGIDSSLENFTLPATDLVPAEDQTPEGEISYRAIREGSSLPTDNLPIRPNERRLDFHRLFRSFMVNWSVGEPYDYMGEIRKRAALVGWKTMDLKSVEITSNAYKRFARKCPGGVIADTNTERPRNQPPEIRTSCRCAVKYGFDPDTWKGQPCPAEVISAFRHFVQYIRALDIKPEDHVDVEQVVEIVKLHLYESRCDEEIQEAEGRLFELRVSEVARDGTAFWEKVISQHLQIQTDLSNRRQKIYDKLLASRASKSQQKVNELKAVAAAGNAKANMTYADAASLLNQDHIRNVRTILIEERESTAVEDETEPTGTVVEAEFQEEVPEEDPEDLLELLEIDIPHA